MTMMSEIIAKSYSLRNTLVFVGIIAAMAALVLFLKSV
jgi:hypothetical protein